MQEISYAKKRKKKINVRNLIIIIVAIIIIWVIMRLLTGNTVIPKPILDIFVKNATNATG